MPLEPLICARTATRVSSVLNRDGKQFGKQHMFDASEETCWNSDQGTCQWVALEFPSSVKVVQLHLQFQGGFSSRLCTLEGCRAGEELVKISHLYPEDTNAMQRFQVEETVLDKLKITFESSTDFFGRIVVYHLGLLGRGSEAAAGDSAGEDTAPSPVYPPGGEQQPSTPCQQHQSAPQSTKRGPPAQGMAVTEGHKIQVLLPSLW